MTKKRRSLRAVFGIAKHRKQIAVGEKAPMELNDRERDLIMNHTFAGNELRILPKSITHSPLKPITILR